MSDAYEQRVFGDVSPTRTAMTDTDADGQSDYSEFAAGTDPTSTNSVFKVSSPAPQPNGSLRFEWASVPGRAYRLQASTDLISWAPQTDWIRATSATSSVLLTPPSGSADYFYQLEVRP